MITVLPRVRYTVPVKGLDTLSHSSEWEGVSKLLTGTVVLHNYKAHRLPGTQEGFVANSPKLGKNGLVL